MMLHPFQTSKVWISPNLLFLIGKFHGKTCYVRFVEIDSEDELDMEGVPSIAFRTEEYPGPLFFPIGPCFLYPGKIEKVFEIVVCEKNKDRFHHILRATNLWQPSAPIENYALPGLLLDFGFSAGNELILICKLRHQQPGSNCNVFRGYLMKRWQGDFSSCTLNSQEESLVEMLPINYPRTHSRFFEQAANNSRSFDVSLHGRKRLAAFPPRKISGQFEEIKGFEESSEAETDSDDDADADDGNENLSSSSPDHFTDAADGAVPHHVGNQESRTTHSHGLSLQVGASDWICKSSGIEKYQHWRTVTALMELNLTGDVPELFVPSVALRRDLPSPGCGETSDQLQKLLIAGHSVQISSSSVQLGQAVFHRRHNINREVLQCHKSVFHPTKPLTAVLNPHFHPGVVRLFFHKEASQDFKDEYNGCSESYRRRFPTSCIESTYYTWIGNEEAIKKALQE
jgi:hypothetical protein